MTHVCTKYKLLYMYASAFDSCCISILYIVTCVLRVEEQLDQAQEFKLNIHQFLGVWKKIKPKYFVNQNNSYIILVDSVYSYHGTSQHKYRPLVLLASPLKLIVLLAVSLAVVASLELVASVASLELIASLVALLVAEQIYLHRRLGVVAERGILALQVECLELDKLVAIQDLSALLDKAVANTELEDRHLSSKTYYTNSVKS